MLERRSALATAHPYRSQSLKIEEARGFSLLQLAGGEASIAKATGALPEKVGVATSHKGRTIFRIGPAQFWAVGPESDDLSRKLEGKCAVTPLTSSRTRILLDGQPARDVLAKGIAIDWHESVFTPRSFALTGVHHMPLVVHCIGDNSFHLYAMRTFAMSVYQWLTDAAQEFADHHASHS
jgi:sarcosine oxidase subunit gamma